MRGSIQVLVLAVTILMGDAGFAAENGHHPHHVAMAAGMAWQNSKNSAYLGADYVYSWPNRWGIGAFYEEVNGDFDLQVVGLLFSRKFGHGWKFNFGPGMERKIKKNKNLFLLRFQAGYDWHSGHWSWGPQLTVDWIEDDNTTIYAGFSVGYGW